MKYDFKPRDQSKIALFSNRAEAIVFWLCIGGLVLFALISLFRYYSLRTVVKAYNELGENLTPVHLKIERLESENDSLRQEISDISAEAESLREEISTLRLQIEQVPSLPGEEPPTIIELPEN